MIEVNQNNHLITNNQCFNNDIAPSKLFFLLSSFAHNFTAIEVVEIKLLNLKVYFH